MHAKVRIAGADVAFDAPEGANLLEVLQSNGYPIATSCGGVASCGLCRLTVVRGAESLSPIRPQELVHLGNVAKIVGLRLACQSRVSGPGPIVVQVPEVEVVEERKRRKAERLRGEAASSPWPERGRDEFPPSSKRSMRGSSEGARSERIEWRPRILDKRDDRG
ncbi:2Fe-2S iron-sulfur cluster-binding protein [Pendulispora albinea]|uniref:(2Fe-2S)-binding protein n=1 Tax=Pendulispora albinea TaxID=2741071 RepID=A0ABZ2LT94_9BACT